ncbi:hypothetical protein GIB67_015367 [Kingdonia uniflora]|uniref:Retrotransposon gag domain-containing protein n=1 Tax=Kingdonia uniflora TaxID=39325 RepID=A0A7J7KZ00_9MAGN|nr:hypothetical protein GIB67_015367 [Kingdonia uniflora]
MESARAPAIRRLRTPREGVRTRASCSSSGDKEARSSDVSFSNSSESITEQPTTTSPERVRNSTNNLKGFRSREELMNQRIREIIEATALDAKDDSHKLQGFHTPKIIKYKGTDPGQHVQQFSDSLDSIDTFKQLQKIFIKAYAHNKDKEENLYSLISLKQAQGEKLEEFPKKFLELAQKVDNLDQKTAVSAFTNALQFNYKAKEYLFLKKPKNLEDMIEKVNNYVNLERMMPEPNKNVKAVHNTKVPSTDSNNNRSSSDLGDPKRAKTDPERDSNQRSQKPSRTVIPKLNAKLSVIYIILQKGKCFRPA